MHIIPRPASLSLARAVIFVWVSRPPFARPQTLETLLRDLALPWHCRLALALPFAKLQPCFAQPVHSIPRQQALAWVRQSFFFEFRDCRLPGLNLETLLRDLALPWHCHLALALPFAKLQPCFAQPVHSISRPGSLSLGQAGILVRVSRLPFARLQTLETLLRDLALP